MTPLATPNVDTSRLPERPAVWAAIATLLIAVAVYASGLGSDHLATNGDELVYTQITRLTAASGHLLPLQTPDAGLRNTKPPLIFWQGIAATNWGTQWSLGNLRAPSVLYTLLTAMLVSAIGWRTTRSLAAALIAGALFLSFFSTYRYGRVFLTSAPETFWLFAPFGLLLLAGRTSLPDGLRWPVAAGLLIGVSLLYKSFALAVPAVLTLAVLQLRARAWHPSDFLRRDVWRLAIVGLVALAVFSIWFLSDPDPLQVLKDFVIRENAGKFRPGQHSYLANLVWGDSSLWRILVSYPLNAGLLAPAVIFLGVDAWKRRHTLEETERFLWTWILVLAAVFCLPNQRDERYLIPAMPAFALLLSMRLSSIPRWVASLTLIACGLLQLGLTGLALILQHVASAGKLYPAWAVLVPVAGLAVALRGLSSANHTRPLLATAILLVYASYAAFLIPLDGAPGIFPKEAVAAVQGRQVFVPSNFRAREESYRFLLPGADTRPYKYRATPPTEAFVVISRPVTAPPPEGRILGRRLNMIDRFTAAETRDMLRGNIIPQLFHWNWLVAQP